MNRNWNKDWRKSIIVMSGGFDPIHKGHLRMFREASWLGHHVVIGLNSDEWLTRKKGKPFMEFYERKEILREYRRSRREKIGPSKEKDKYKDWVLQEYINNPLLVKGRKFHIRIYYLVYRTEAFVYNVGKIITAGEKYKREDYSNKKIHDSHITDSLQGMFFPESLKLTKKREKEVWGQIIELFKDIKKLGKFECFPESKDCYQIFGADLMITDNYQVKMLELNTKLGFNEFEGIRFNKYLIENEMQTIVDNIFPPEKKQEPIKDKYFMKI